MATPVIDDGGLAHSGTQQIAAGERRVLGYSVGTLGSSNLKLGNTLIRLSSPWQLGGRHPK